MKLQVGKTYINRKESEKVTIVSYNESEYLYRFTGNNGKMYGPTGEYHASLGDTPEDLVKQVKN